MKSNGGGTFGGAPFADAMRATLGDLLGGAKERTMRTRDEIDAIVAARNVATDATAGAHDARVALAARELAQSDEAIRWELRAVLNAPRAYAVAYLDTMLARVAA